MKGEPETAVKAPELASTVKAETEPFPVPPLKLTTKAGVTVVGVVLSPPLLLESSELLELLEGFREGEKVGASRKQTQTE